LVVALYRIPQHELEVAWRDPGATRDEAGKEEAGSVGEAFEGKKPVADWIDL